MEVRPSEVSVQARASNHLKQHSLKVIVVSVEEKSVRKKNRQIGISKTNANEPLMTRREFAHNIKTKGEKSPWDKSTRNLITG